MSNRRMRFHLSLWLCIAVLGAHIMTGEAFGRDKDKDKDRAGRSTANSEAASKTQAVCQTGTAVADLDINNVRARLFNTGSLFYNSSTGDEAVYEVPKGSNRSAVYAHGLWIGGTVDGELRMSAATYAQEGETYEMFPGPLDASGNPPANCAPYDRLYKVNREDIRQYEASGVTTEDLENWPFDLGAPVIDGDGNPDNYNLAGGDRPEVLGDQTIWWVMNDAAGPHLTTKTNPIGLEVQVTAFAFKTSDALNNTTFYKYKIFYRPRDNKTIENVYVGLWSDPDLGEAGDDFVGSDTTLGLGYVYNGDNFDEGDTGYGNRPPALGYDFFQGPTVPPDGIDNDDDGEIDEEGERLKMTKYIYYDNINDVPTGNPDAAAHYYGYLTGFWTDGTRITFGGNGYGGTEPADFMFPAMPPEYWSEDNADGSGGRNTPSDRRFIMATGPFTMQPGDIQELVFGIVWSQSPTGDRLRSVQQLKADDLFAQAAFDLNFNLPPLPDPPEVTAAEMDQQVVLEIKNPPASNNYLNQYDELSAYLTVPDAEDETFTFEGYKIFQYPSLNTPPDAGTLIATLDVPNDVTTIVGPVVDPETGAVVSRILARGSDAGVKNYFVVERDFLSDGPLRNFTEYVYGVQAYAYNAFSSPPILESPITRVVVVPNQVTAREGGTVINSELGTDLVAERTEGIGEGQIGVTIAKPTDITGHDYEVVFYRIGGASGDSLLTYDVVDRTANQVEVDGRDYFQRTGEAMPLGEDLFVVDGLSFTITGPDPAFTSFQVVSNAEGPLDPPEIGTFAFNNNGFPFLGESDRPTDRQQVGAGAWGIQQGNDPTLDSYDDFVNMVTRGGLWWETILPNNFEIRFTERGGKALVPAAYGFPENVLIDVPFELWNIGTSAGPEDDVRYFPYVLDNDFSDPEGGLKFSLGTQAGLDSTWGPGAVPADHAVSGGNDDPYTDLFYWFIPENQSPGEAGYNELVALIESNPAAYEFTQGTAGRVLERMVFVNWNGGDVATGEYTQDMVETGTVFRIITSKPIAEGDVYQVSTEGLGKETNVAEAAEEALEKITIVPNPYRGASDYDVGQFEDQVRITNLPRGSSIRVYSLSGSLIFEDTQRSDSNFYRWSLQTSAGLPVASGIYLIHVQVPDLGERVLKFGVVKKRVQMDVF